MAVPTTSIKEEKSPRVEQETTGGTNDRPSTEENELDNYLSGFPLFGMVVALVLGQFIIGLDSSIVGSLVPTLAEEFNSLADVGWYGSAYLMVMGATQPSFGKMYATFSVKTVFVVSVLVLEAGSVTCATAKNSSAFIIGRALTGLGAAGVLSGTQIVVAFITPLHKRPMYGGVVGAGEIVAFMAGPIMGGVMIDTIGWPWCFWINLPVGALLIAALVLFFKGPPQATQGVSLWTNLGKLDLPGGVVLAGSMTCLLLALDWGGVKYAWSDARVVVPLVAFAILLILAAFDQHRKKDMATIPTRFFKSRTFVTCLWYGFCLSGSQLVLFYYLPTWLQGIAGDSPKQSTVDMAPSLAASIVGTAVSTVGAAVLGCLPPCTIIGSILVTIGAGLMYQLNPHTPKAQWMVFEVLYGFGCGMSTQQSVIGIQVALAKADIPIGTSTIMVGRSLGAAIFIAVGQNVFISRLAPISELIPDFDAASGASIGQDYLRSRVSPEEFDTALNIYNDAITRVFMISIILGCLATVGSAFIPWTPLKSQKEAKEAETAADDSEQSGSEDAPPST